MHIYLRSAFFSITDINADEKNKKNTCTTRSNNPQTTMGYI